MQPQTLTMKNFGPFIEETVDFRVFDGQGLFLISGKTGAGKTTIFDAMTYALFGQTSGKLRSPKEMRSSFADDSAATEVSFTFEHGGFSYAVTRRPEQVLTRSRGEGLAKKAAKTSLVIYDAAGQEQQELTKGVDKYIQDLLHLTADQFFKIIMLPQGDFRNFLVASSLDKEQVLRQLFDTQLYQDVTDWLKQKAEAGATALAAVDVKATTLAEHFQWQEPQEYATWAELADLWQADLALLAEKAEALQKTVEKAEVAEKVAEQAYYQGKELQGYFEEQTQLAVQFQVLTDQKAKMNDLAKQLQSLSWAQENRHLLREKEQSQTVLEDCLKQVTDTQHRLQSVQEKLTTWTEAKVSLATVQESLVEEQKQLTQKELLLPVAAQQDELTTALGKVTAKRAQIEVAVQTLQEQGQAMVTEKDVVQELLLTEADLQQQRLALAQLAATKDRLVQLEQEQSQLAKTITEEVATHKNQRQQEKQLTKQVQQTYEELLQVKSRQASLMIAKLSRDLLPGEPCPVCGSLEHPKAQLGEVPLEDIGAMETRLKSLEERWQQESQSSALAKAESERLAVSIAQQQGQQRDLLATCQEVLTKFIHGLANFGRPEAQSIPASLDLYHQSESQVDQKLATIEQAKETLTTITAREQELATKVAEIQQRQQAAKEEQSRLQGELASLKRQLAGVDLADLTQAVASLQASIQMREQQLQDHRTQGETLHQEHTTLVATLAQQQEQAETAQKKVETAAQALTTCLAEVTNPEDEAAFRSLVSQLPQLPQLQAEKQDYDKQLDYVVRNQEKLQQRLAEQVMPDLATLLEVQVAAQEATSQARNQLAACLAQQASNEQILKQLTRLIKENETLVARQSELTQLTDTISGRNRYKTSLERYILQNYLQEVLVVANERLVRLTRGRYQFQLAGKSVGGRGQKGLDVDIYDDNSGQTRRVQTLSGGESFIAALALALSLADVIQNRAGGIPIEALFIDEGFGSLDEESLEMALEALSMIETEGRLIGIISHVQELKERISRKLLVKAQGTGQSRIELTV